MKRTKTATTAPTKIIGSEGTYIGNTHKWAAGLRIQVVAILRDGEALYDDHTIGEIRATDTIEFAPEIVENGKRRWSWVLSDATITEIEFAA